MRIARAGLFAATVAMTSCAAAPAKKTSSPRKPIEASQEPSASPSAAASAAEAARPRSLYDPRDAFRSGVLPTSCIGSDLSFAHLAGCTCDIPMHPHGARTWCGQAIESRRLDALIELVVKPLEPQVHAGAESKLLIAIVNKVDQRVSLVFEAVHTSLVRTFQLIDEQGRDLSTHNECGEWGSSASSHTLVVLEPYGRISYEATWHAATQILRRTDSPRDANAGSDCTTATVPVHPGKYTIIQHFPLLESQGPQWGKTSVEVIP